MKKVIITLCVVAVIALFGGRAVWLYQQRETDNNVLKIGAILPFSSSMPRTASEILKSLKIAEQNINADPKYNHKVKLIVEDGKFEAKGTISAFQKLVSHDIHALIVFADLPAKSIVRFVKKRKMPTLIIGGATDYPVLSPYMFKVPISMDTYFKQLVKYIASDDDIHTIGITYMDVFGIKDQVPMLKTELNKYGREVISVEKYKENVIGAKDHVLKMQNKNPDAVIVLGYGDNTYPATINYFREYGYDNPIFSHFAIPTVVHLIKKTDNLYFVDLMLQQDEETNTFKNDFSQKFEGAEPDSFAGFSYAAEKMIAQTAQKADIRNPDLFMKELKSTPFFNSPYGKMEIVGEETYVPVVVKKVLPDGTIQVVKE